MTSFNVACAITKVAFVFVLVGYIILAAVLLMFSGFINSGQEARDLELMMLCGGVYIIGSIFAVGDKLSVKAMAAVGIFLNLLGAVFWVPTVGSNDPQFAVIGIILSVLWITCIILRFSNTGANRSKYNRLN